MTGADPQRILSLWEAGSSCTAAERPKVILDRSSPGRDAGELEGLTLAERDALLLSLRAELFGDRLDCTVPCNTCGEELVFQLPVYAMTPPPERGEGPPVDQVSSGNYVVRFRDPMAADLECAGQEGSMAEAKAELLRRCVLSAQENGSEVETEALPQEVLTAVGSAMSSRAGEATVRLVCPSCGKEDIWAMYPDVFLWEEITASAKRMLGEVHLLASRYGWSEEAILAMTPARRQGYLTMVLDDGLL